MIPVNAKAGFQPGMAPPSQLICRRQATIFQFPSQSIQYENQTDDQVEKATFPVIIEI
jgi:hypothetical protein